MTSFAWACEGRSWGPRARAATFPEATAVGVGPRARVLDPDQTWRSVRWCEPSPLRSFTVVAGDPGVAALADPGALSIGVQIGGQDPTPACLQSRQVDVMWDCEAFPLHRWAGAVLPSRGSVRASWEVEPEQIVVGYMPPSWAPRIFDAVRAAVPKGVIARRLIEPEAMVGCDLLVVAAGWATTFEARWSGVPHFAVNLGRRDHPVRANAELASALSLIGSGVRRVVDLPDELVPQVPDHREQFLDLAFARA